MTIEQRLAKLEKTVNALVEKLCEEKFYTDADISGLSITESNHERDITDNRQGIIETFESELVNAQDIADVRTAIEEVYEMINMEE